MQQNEEIEFFRLLLSAAFIMSAPSKYSYFSCSCSASREGFWLISAHLVSSITSRNSPRACNSFRGIYITLVVLEASHPFRPVLGFYAASSGPGVVSVQIHREVGLPSEHPEFFESDLAHREVHKQAVDRSVMPVDAEIVHAAKRK